MHWYVSLVNLSYIFIFYDIKIVYIGLQLLRFYNIFFKITVSKIYSPRLLINKQLKTGMTLLRLGRILPVLLIDNFTRSFEKTPSNNKN